MERSISAKQVFWESFDQNFLNNFSNSVLPKIIISQSILVLHTGQVIKFDKIWGSYDYPTIRNIAGGIEYNG